MNQQAAFPTNSFRSAFTAQIQMIEALCRRSLEQVRLLEEVLGGNPITISSYNRGKRQIFAGIAAGLSLLLSGYNTYELSQISSEVSDLRANQHHLLKAVKGLALAMNQIQKQSSEIANKMNSIGRQVNIITFETRLLHIGQLSLGVTLL